MKPTIVTASILTLLLPLSALSVPLEAGQEAQLERKVKDSLGGRDLRNIEVAVQGSEATLTGRVPHFWAKDRAIKQALDVDGIETVASELELPEAEGDADLAEAVIETVQRYPYYTMFDHIYAQIDQGEVFLGGWVTSDRRKSTDLFERVAKIQGVQDISNKIETLPVNQSDHQIRVSIGRQLARHTLFERVLRQRHPPFRIVVKQGAVALFGYVQGNAEMVAIQSIARQTRGVRRVENQLQNIQ